jgi:hypothetical protein
VPAFPPMLRNMDLFKSHDIHAYLRGLGNSMHVILHLSLQGAGLDVGPQLHIVSWDLNLMGV